MPFSKVILQGNIGSVAAQHPGRDGKASTRFTLAVDVGWGDKKETQWWTCWANGKTAEIAAQYLAVGDTYVTVEGRPSARLFSGANGPSVDLQCHVRELHLGRKSGGNAGPAPDRDSDDDDMPF